MGNEGKRWLPLTGIVWMKQREVSRLRKKERNKRARSGTMAGGVSGAVGRKAGKMNRNRSGGRRMLGAGPGRGDISWCVDQAV